MKYVPNSVKSTVAANVYSTSSPGPTGPGTTSLIHPAPSRLNPTGISANGSAPKFLNIAVTGSIPSNIPDSGERIATVPPSIGSGGVHEA